MAKGSLRGGDPEGTTRKRRKVVHEAPTSEDVHTSRQLRQLLAFDQDLRKARHGLQSFKLFLESVSSEDIEHHGKLPILREYLESTRPRDEYENAVFMPDIMETWSFAVQVNNDSIMSAVPVVLALLMRVLSERLDLVGHGIGIGRTLLQKRHQELLARNLSAEKGKEFIISPTLRLLREVLCLDGGALAMALFRARSQTFKSLARNIGIKYLGDGVEDPKRPSARTNAVRFLLSAFKYLHHEARRELLGQRDLVSGLVKSIKDDPPHLVLEILETLKTYILLDEKLPREAKAKLLTSATLSRVAMLYGYDNGNTDDAVRLIPQAAHDFLVVACTHPSSGLLRQQSGFYPKGVDQAEVSAYPGAGSDDWSSESAVWMDRFKEDIPVCNLVLSEFIQTLRPWSSIKQAELVVLIFRAAPELVAKYFLDKKSFTFEPKLSATWIGYASFLFDVVRLQIPQYFGHRSGYFHLPPPTNIVLDSVIPPPLNQKALGRCLSLKSNLISFFATRLLIVCIEKLQAALQAHVEASETNNASWEVARRALLDEFCQRSPQMKDIINAYRSIPNTDFLHLENTARLLRLYYETIPQVALTARFDVSPFLAGAIERLNGENVDPEDRAMAVMELKSLLAIAQYSPGVRWFSKLERLSFSPFVAVMRLYVEATAGAPFEELKDMLQFVAEEHQLVLLRQGDRGLLPFLECLKSVRGSNHRASLMYIWGFLDNCASRCANYPIKYLDMAFDLASTGSGSDSQPAQGVDDVVSPFLMAMLEQLPFLAGSPGTEALGAVVGYLSKLAECLLSSQEDNAVIRAVFEKMAVCLPEESPYGSLLVIPHGMQYRDGETKGLDVPPVPEPREEPANAAPGKEYTPSEIEGLMHTELDLDMENSALTKWYSKTADELVDEDYLIGLIRLLSSEHHSIRKQALINLGKAAVKIQQSDYDEREQVWLMLSELTESAREAISSGPLASPVVSFASHCLEVLKNPLHCLYGKVNAFLTKGPVWSLDKLPLIHEILQEEPSTEDSYYKELDWLLVYLLDGLRTSQDVALFHKRRVFERLCALLSNPYMKLPLRLQVFRILYRTTCIPGGSSTLVTRFGMVGWLEALSACGVGKEADMCSALLRRVWDTCDQQRISKWSKHGVVKSLCQRLAYEGAS